MDFLSYIVNEALILVPVLNVLGIFVKNTDKISDKYIPLILLGVSIILSIALIGLSVQAVIQGILVAGAAVLTNELIKQNKR